ncbi:MAG: hypothetical protein ACI4V7_06675, partial [Succinivibrionaceae bacterium]
MFYKKITITKLLSLCIGFSACGSALAEATDPLYKVEVINDIRTSFEVGPFAKSITNGDNPAVASIVLKNNTYDFLERAPHNYDEGQALYFIDYCYLYSTEDVCDNFRYITNGFQKWFDDKYNSIPQVLSLVTDSSRGIVGKELQDNEMIVNQIYDNGNAVGYRNFESSKIYSRYSIAIAKINDKEYILKPNTTFDKYDFSWSSALTMRDLGSGKYLVGGYSAVRIPRDVFVEECLMSNYEYDFYSCPGFSTQATLWLIDTNNSDTTIKPIIAPKYWDDGSNTLMSAAVNKIVKYSDKYFALGYSSTSDYTTYAKS